MVEESLRNMRLDYVDLVQLHGWNEHFIENSAWWEMLSTLRDAGKIRMIGVAINSFDPKSALRLVEQAKVDVIQVHYNVFEQSPADELFPAAAKAGVGVIVGAPLEESALSGNLTEKTRFREGDIRSVYFAGDRLHNTVERVEKLRPVLERAAGDLVRGALRFCLSAPEVSTVIPGIRRVIRAEENASASDAGPLSEEILKELREHHRWERSPADW